MSKTGKSRTIADAIAERERFFVNCGHPACCHSVTLDLEALAERLGHNHGAMHDDLVQLFTCTKCGSASRERRAPFFTAFLTMRELTGGAWVT